MNHFCQPPRLFHAPTDQAQRWALREKPHAWLPGRFAMQETRSDRHLNGMVTTALGGGGGAQATSRSGLESSSTHTTTRPANRGFRTLSHSTLTLSTTGGDDKSKCKFLCNLAICTACSDVVGDNIARGAGYPTFEIAAVRMRMAAEECVENLDPGTSCSEACEWMADIILPRSSFPPRPPSAIRHPPSAICHFFSRPCSPDRSRALIHRPLLKRRRRPLTKLCDGGRMNKPPALCPTTQSIE
jgi:hypothetical protein